MRIFSSNDVKQLQGSAVNEFNLSSHLLSDQAINLLSLEVIRSIIIYLITHFSHLIWTVEHSLTIWANTLFRRSIQSERSLTPSSRLIHIQKMTLGLLLSRLIHFQKMSLRLLFLMSLCHHSLLL